MAHRTISWLLLASGCLLAQLPPGTHRQTLLHGGLTRTYLLHIPPSYDGRKPVPLLLAFHGGGEAGNSLTAERGLGFTPLSDQKGFIVAYPDGVNHHWNDGRVSPRFPAATKVDDVGFISALIGQLSKTYKIDSRRIYASGASNGGFFSQRLGAELSHTFAAIGPAAGTIGKDLVARFAPAEPVSVMYLHGTADPAVPFNGGMVIGRGGLVISAREMVALWTKADGCPSSATVEDLPHKDPNDPTRVRKETYSPCRDGTAVVFFEIEGGGHNWPGRGVQNRTAGNTTRDLNAAEAVWEFFQQHPKSQGTGNRR